MSNLPLYSFPLTVALIDNDALVLQALTNLLKAEYHLKAFDNPKKALENFKQYSPLSATVKLLSGCAESENYNLIGHLPVDVKLDGIKTIAHHPLRTEEVGVMIVDYSMPEMNGIEFCRELKSLPAKKILLTGEASNHIATQAFNEGIIDCFLQKGSPSLAEEINFHINSLMQKYRIENAKQLISHLETDYQLPVSDPQFALFFNEWCQTNNITEFYIIDQNANFLLINSNQEKFYFITHTDRTLNNFIEFYEDEKDVCDYVSAVKSREIIPFFGEGRESWDFPFAEWRDFFVTPNVLVGREKYYWFVVKRE